MDDKEHAEKKQKEMHKTLQYIFSVVNDDLKFAETKNGLLLTFSVAAIAALFSLLSSWMNDSPLPENTPLTLALFNGIVCLIFFILIACIFSLLALKPSPLNNRLKDNYLSYMGISQIFPQRLDNTTYQEFYNYLKNNYDSTQQKIGISLLQRIYAVSSIAKTKFQLFHYALSNIILGIVSGLALTLGSYYYPLPTMTILISLGAIFVLELLFLIKNINTCYGSHYNKNKIIRPPSIMKE